MEVTRTELLPGVHLTAVQTKKFKSSVLGMQFLAPLERETAALNALLPHGFRHYEQSVRVVERLENDGKGLNLTLAVRDGIREHTSKGHPRTLEGAIVSLSDRIAYINHDIDDAMRAGILTNDDIPREISDVLGETHRERINTLVTDMIFHSRGTGELGMTPEIEQTMQALRQFMFERVYKNPVAKGEESKARRILQELYTYYIAHPEALPQDFQPQLTFEGLPRVVCDYIAGMTDKYAMYKYDELFIPTGWQVRG